MENTEPSALTPALTPAPTPTPSTPTPSTPTPSTPSTPTPMVKINGMNVIAGAFPVMEKQRIDERRFQREMDTLLVTYPRTGTTWLTQIVSTMLVAEDQIEEESAKMIHLRAPFLEMKQGADVTHSVIETLPDATQPRALKTHLSYRFVSRWLEEDKLKSILTTRNPKDTLVSHFHFYHNIPMFGFTGTWNEFFEHYVKGDNLINGDPYDWYRDWHDNKGGYEVLILKYEDMKEDLIREIRKIESFLGLSLSESHVRKVAEGAGVEQMRGEYLKHTEKTSTFKDKKMFIRKGQCGEWKKYFTVAQNEWFDAKYKKLYEELDIDVDYN